MIKQILTLVILLFGAALAEAAPKDAVVRIRSHGCSGTVIATTQGRSWILTCAHAWEKTRDKTAPIIIDSPSPSPGAVVRNSSPRLAAIDYKLDLALIEMTTGPLPYTCPVAPVGTNVRVCTSVGYDGMRWPAVTTQATVWGVRTSGTVTYTHERPRSGRSGGPLISECGRLVGVVSGYELQGSMRGMYASHQAILTFLGSRQSTPAYPYYAPRVWEERTPRLPTPGCPPNWRGG